MSISFSLSSLGFVARFILAFVIIAYLYSKNRTDPAIRKGFIVLVALGAAVIVLGIIFFSVFFIAGGAAFLGNALVDFNHIF